MEMWLFYNDAVMTEVLGPITTRFIDSKEHDGMLEWKNCVLAQGVFEVAIPSALKVEWYSQNVRDGVERFVFRGFWTANKTREEALIAKYGSLNNI